MGGRFFLFDLNTTFHAYLDSCVFVALVISFVWLFLVQWFGKFVVWTTLIAINVLSFGFTGYIWYGWWNIKQGRAASDTINNFLPGSENNELVLMIIGTVTVFIFNSLVN